MTLGAYRGSCSCGWRGPWRAGVLNGSVDAHKDAAAHHRAVHASGARTVVEGRIDPVQPSLAEETAK